MIRILPTTMVNRIAAGEVIERPGSVVKELAENALDAGATRIEVWLEAGGKQLIAVQDDGIGMEADELALAVQRHATSKLPDDDLVHIAHFGFRGEALPSIGSVSRMTITSRTANATEASVIHIEGGEVSAVMPSAGQRGTRVEVRDLFFATPARLKFLKTERTETAAAEEHLARLAMAHPGVSFRLTADGRNLLALDAAQGELLDAQLRRIVQVLGADAMSNLVPIDGEREGIRIRGFAGLPTFNRASPSHQYLFINGRPVRDKLLLGVIRAAYRDFLAHDRYPVLVVFLEMPADVVDVNVHPAKAEVRFRQNDPVKGLVLHGIREALASAGFKASTTVAAATLQSFQPASVIPFPQQRSGATQAAYAAAMSLQEPAGQYQTAFPAVMEHPPLAVQRAAEMPVAEETHFPLGAACAQVHGTYVVAQTDQGIVIVDQHAAHERLLYERMKAQIAVHGITRQPLLIPEVVELGESACHRLLEEADRLVSLGLVVEPFGGGAVLVREVPANLGEINVQGLLRDLADQIEAFGRSTALDDALGHFCGTLACHMSIRAGRKLAVHEMNALLRQMEATPHSGQCNHGRPTYVELKLADIERLFGRKG